jgi:S-adenosylmethionine decarboxylase
MGVETERDFHGSGVADAGVGTHALLDLFDVPADRLRDADLLASALIDAAAAANMTALSAPVLHRFPGGGLTGFLPLAESHIAFHTYPERGYLAADVFTCGACPPDAAVAVLRAAFQPGREVVRFVARGASPAAAGR